MILDLRGVGALALSVLISVPAAAQMSADFSMVGSSVSGIITPVILNPCTAGGCGSAARSYDGARAGTPTRAAAVDTRYRPSPALKREAVAGYVSRIRRKNPAAADKIAEQFRIHDYSTEYRRLTRGSQLSDNDTTDIMTGYTVLAWLVANGGIREVDDASVAAVRQQVAARLAANRQFAAPAARAKLGEETKLLFITMFAGWDGAQREGRTRMLSDGVAAMFRNQVGQDLRALSLTRHGLVDR